MSVNRPHLLASLLLVYSEEAETLGIRWPGFEPASLPTEPCAVRPRSCRQGLGEAGALVDVSTMGWAYLSVCSLPVLSGPVVLSPSSL